MKTTEEYIVCSAIWYKELDTQTFLPKNIDKGIVICGLRHANCIDTVKTLAGLRSVRFGADSVGETIQGFLTNKNRFVDRKEGKEIAIKANQVNENEMYNKKILHSEDLW